MSIFYSDKSWGNLLKSCIYPLTNRLLKENYIKGFLIALSRQKGDHLEISLYCKNACFNTVAQEVHKIVNEFLLAKPSRKKRKDGFQEFFKDSKNNTLCYNLYQLKIHDDNIITIEMKMAISLQVLKYFSQNNVDFESLLSFLIYFQLQLIHNAQSAFVNKEIHILSTLEKSLKMQANDSKKSHIAQTFMENFSIILGISEAIKRNNVISCVPEMDWIELTRNGKSKKASLPIIINEISRTVYLTLGLHPKEQPMNTYFLLKTLSFKI